MGEKPTITDGNVFRVGRGHRFIVEELETSRKMGEITALRRLCGVGSGGSAVAF